VGSLGPLWWPSSCREPPAGRRAGPISKAYEAKFGAGTINQFSGHATDVGEDLKRVVPIASKTQARHPGIARRCSRRSRAKKEIPASHGVYNFTPTDHFGPDNRGRVLLTSRTATGRCSK